MLIQATVHAGYQPGTRSSMMLHEA